MKITTIIAASISLFIVSCTQSNQEIKPNPGTPESLQEKSDNEISFNKSRKREDLVESLYAELLEKSPELNELEKTIDKLAGQKQDSSTTFEKFDQKNISYYTATGNYVERIQDSLLQIKIKTIIDNSLNTYNRRIAVHKNLISILDAKDVGLQDLHILLKLVKTLPVIEKYQAENTPSVKPLEKVIGSFDRAIQQADSLAWN